MGSRAGGCSETKRMLGIVPGWLRGKSHTCESLGFKTSDLKDQDRGLSFDASDANASLWRTRQRTWWRRLFHSCSVAQQASQRTGPPGISDRGWTSAAAMAHTTHIRLVGTSVVAVVSLSGMPELSVWLLRLCIRVGYSEHL